MHTINYMLPAVAHVWLCTAVFRWAENAFQVAAGRKRPGERIIEVLHEEVLYDAVMSPESFSS